MTKNQINEVTRRLKAAGWEMEGDRSPSQIDFRTGTAGARFYLDTGGPAGIVSIRIYGYMSVDSTDAYYGVDLGHGAHCWGGQPAGDIPAYHCGNLRWALGV